MIRSFAILLAMPLLAGACSNSHEAELEALLVPYVGNVPGAAIVVIRNGEAVVERAVGLANLDTGETVTPDTNFRLASVTKQFTAAAILTLVETGRLGLDETMVEIFPEFPPYGERISVRLLLSHTSGLIDYEHLIPDTATVPVFDQDVLRMMMDQDSTYFPPGSEYRYSNGGYAVLAMIVEARSGRSFVDYLQAEVFRPAGMTSTVAFREGINTVPNRALGYTVEGDSIMPSDQSITSAVLGDGGIYSSLRDMRAWDQALYTDRVLPVELWNAAMTPATSAEDGATGYGFGWRIDEYRGRRRVHHTGSTSGFRNVIVRYPDDRCSVIILTNRRDPSVSALADRLTDLYLFMD